LINIEYLTIRSISWVERVAPGITSRTNVFKPVLSGIILLDSLLPIGQGQRQLIIGDKQTGKTTLCIMIILNQGLRLKSIISKIEKIDFDLLALASKFSIYVNIFYFVF
jgi:F0F1-type ATP synthase alpha subunit